ncbi:hypothetical protein Vadar_021001 [Vaccinium darrowii]|uniref:Uncharacterized protein n=1 Tax=Vaccinium darrowii TaxID=229202 RepID=A0ACB7YPM2_9ERIC|nr:hypothetical protein Vadar_021001 [Vaccinium darrowii]
MSKGNDTTWVGRKPTRRLEGMSDALSIAADLGFSEEFQNLSTTGDKGDVLIRVLREFTTVQKEIADLQVKLQGLKDGITRLWPVQSSSKCPEDKNVAHLTHVSEMEKKIETLARITMILKDVIWNKDRVIACLQLPYSWKQNFRNNSQNYS